MKRNNSGIKLKENLYKILADKFNKVGVIPHPRENLEELKIIERNGLEALHELVYYVKGFKKTIIVVNGSSGKILDYLGVKYYYLSLSSFFIYGDTRRIVESPNVIAEIRSLEELKNFDFARTKNIT